MEVGVKKIAISLVLAASLGLAACSGKEQAAGDITEAEGDITQVVEDAAKAQKAASLTPELKAALSAAKGNATALGKVWEKANANSVTSVADEANLQLENLLLPQANAAKRSSDALAITKQAPLGSPARVKLQAIDNALLLKETKQ
jgi:hypothetical protein